jgi:hypothetical protein
MVILAIMKPLLSFLGRGLVNPAYAGCPRLSHIPLQHIYGGRPASVCWMNPATIIPHTTSAERIPIAFEILYRLHDSLYIACRHTHTHTCMHANQGITQVDISQHKTIVSCHQRSVGLLFGYKIFLNMLVMVHHGSDVLEKSS